MNKKTIIIGGGLSGLSAAYNLKKKGEDFILLEKSQRFGGVIESFTDNQNIWDKAAISFSMTPEIMEMVTAFGLENELVQASAKSNARFILFKNKLRKLTPSPLSIFKSPLLSWKAKFRLLKETKVSTKTHSNETVSEFVSRRFGKELYERVANAVLSGIYAGDPEKMEVKSVLHRFVEMEQEHGSIIKGMKASKGANKRVISSFKNGTGVLLDALGAFVQENSKKDSEVESISKLGSGYSVKLKTGEQLETERVIICTPSYVTASLIQGLDKSLASELESIPYANVEMTHLSYDHSQIKKKLEGFGFLAPKIENAPLLGAVINSSAFDNRSGSNQVMFTIFSRPDLGHTSHGAQKKLEELLKISGEPKSRFLTKWPKAIPQFHVGHSELMKVVDQFETQENIIISGNFRSGVSVGDCVKYQKEVIS